MFMVADRAASRAMSAKGAVLLAATAATAKVNL